MPAYLACQCLESWQTSSSVACESIVYAAPDVAAAFKEEEVKLIFSKILIKLFSPISAVQLCHFFLVFGKDKSFSLLILKLHNQNMNSRKLSPFYFFLI